MKKRLDLILFEHGFFETKNAALAAILAGNVKIGDRVILKAGELIDEAKLFFAGKQRKTGSKNNALRFKRCI